MKFIKPSYIFSIKPVSSLLLGLIFFIVLTGCQSILITANNSTALAPTVTATWPPPPTATATIGPPTPIPARHTATATPTSLPPTPFPTPTVTPVSEVGFYSDPAIGFSFSYPAEWEADENSEGVVIQAEEPRIFVAGQSNVLNENETATDYAALFYGWVGDSDQVRVTEDTSTQLWDGTEAQVIEFSEPDGFFKARATLVMRGRRVFMILVAAPESTYDNYPETISAIAASLRVEEPRPFGISRRNGMVLAGGQPSTLDPILTHGSAGGRIGQIFSGLVMLDQNLRVIPDLAERWEVSQDGLAYTFYLREDATFHNGKPVTAHDVKFSWERAADPANESDTAETYLGDIVGVKAKYRGEADQLSGVEVIDDHTLQVTIDAPKAYFLAKLTYPTSFIVDEANVTLEDWEHQPNGSGPFRLVTWEDDEVFILERNDSFYLDPPRLEHITYLMYPDVPMWMYENDEIDQAGVGVSNIERVTDPTNPLSRDLHIVPSLCTSRLVFGMTQPPFDDPLVRQAFAYTVDRQALSEIVLKGLAEPARSILPPGMPGYSAETNAPSFDREKALTLLDQSSYGGADNLPEITLTIGGRSSTVSGANAAMIDMWRTHLGVEVTVQQLDPENYLSEIREQAHQLVSSGWCADYPDPENFLDLLYHSESKENVGEYHNSDIDHLLEQARVEPDVETRLALYHQIEQQIIADTPDILLQHGQSYFLLKPHVQNFLFTPTSLALNWRVVSVDQTGE